MAQDTDQNSELNSGHTVELEERRTEPDLAQIWNLLRAVDKKVDLHLEEENNLRPKLLALISVLEMSRGALVFIKWSAATGTVLAAIYTWASTHLTFRL